MHCRNCGNEVSEKAVGCPKCGLDPRTEKNFCPECGVQTNPNQVVCTKCGVSLENKTFSLDASALQNLDIKKLTKSPAIIFAAIALIGYFMTWLKFSADMGMFGGSYSFSGSRIASFLDRPDAASVSTIIIPMLLHLFPLCCLGTILSDFVPQIAKYKKIFSIGAFVLVIYAAIGIFTTKIELPDMEGFAANMAEKMADKISFSAGFGLYLSLAGAAASAFFSGFLTKK